jgi:hypothetical protein
MAACVVGEHPPCALGKRLFLDGIETRACETERLSYHRNHDAMRSQAAAPRVHLDLPALVDGERERREEKDVAI